MSGLGSIRLDSRFTIFWKVIFPIIWVSGMAALCMFGAMKDAEFLAITAPIFATGFLWMFLTNFKYKRVVAQGNALRVSNFIHEITVPYSQVLRVKQTNLLRFATIYLKESTRFGANIVFLPNKYYYLIPWRVHPSTKLILERAGLPPYEQKRA